jgi:Arc/MetJ-type ribon-helix-helix transcriptional regulator
MARKKKKPAAPIDPDLDFNPNATDDLGHHEKLQCNVPPQWLGSIAEVVESKKWPYKTRSHVVRHAILRHLKWLEGQQGVPSNIHQISLIDSLVSEVVRRKEFEETMSRFSEMAHRLLHDGDITEARRIVFQVKDTIASMQDGYWKSKYQTTFRNTVGHIIGLERKSPDPVSIQQGPATPIVFSEEYETDEDLEEAAI